ncbi:MAG: response regulator [Phormidesmis sp. RL_2_1]|nr:response regulator [Phormidesmis sp. RL_2_1]
MTDHILVVDDEPDIEALITQKFRSEIRQGQYQFTFTCNGAEAYHQITQTPDIDMVLTDINMPVMDGLELLSRLNALVKPPKTVVVSAYGDMDKIRAAMNRGAFDFVTKPINFQDLATTVEKTLKAASEAKAHQSHLQQIQMQLVQSEKMSSLGQMVAGLAHEIKNPVSFIYGNLEPAKDYVQNLLLLIDLYQTHYPQPISEIQNYVADIDLDFLQEDLAKLLDSLEIGTSRLKELVRSLSNFSRLDQSEKKAMDIHGGIESTLVILSGRLKATADRPNIEIIRDYGQLPLVDCYPSQLNQVIMNLLVNAVDALDEQNQGRSFGEIEANPNVIQIITRVADNSRVRLTIIDNGPGIDDEIVSKLFDPFFTTKPMGKGTGLGLAISYQIIVEKHGGQLLCDSTPGQGTKFVIELPI